LFVDPIWRNLLYIPCGNGELIQTLLSGLGRRTIFTTVNGVSTLRLFTIAHLDVFFARRGAITGFECFTQEERGQ
jgi:hypothetical protein